jgi:signal transduction histidine kinase
MPTGLIVALLISAGAAAVVGGAGWLTLARAQRSSLRLLLTGTLLVNMLSIAAGVGCGAVVMFSTTHDVVIVFAVLAAALLVAYAGVWRVTRSAARAITGIEQAMQQIGADADRPRSIDGPRELRHLSSLIQTSHGRVVDARRHEELADRSRRDLIAWVSHDLRTPLAGLRAMTEALEDGVVSDRETVHRYHGTMRTEVDHLASLVDELFELARLQSGAAPQLTTPVPIADLVSDVLASTEPVARDKRVRLSGRSPKDLPLVDVNVPEVNRALRNLLINAIRHTPSDGTVHVVGMSDADSVFVSVEDSCGGIPEADLPNIFNVAFRGERSRGKLHEGGAGLGLAIARGIVEAHQGDITVDNVGPGCRFVIRLPRSVAAMPAR